MTDNNKKFLDPQDGNQLSKDERLKQIKILFEGSPGFVLDIDGKKYKSFAEYKDYLDLKEKVDSSIKCDSLIQRCVKYFRRRLKV
jgi:hypothetical protein